MNDNSIVNMEIPDNHVLIINDSTYKRLEEFAERFFKMLRTIQGWRQ